MTTLDYDRAFYFCNGIDQPNGKFAVDLVQFSEELKTVDIKSIIFHLYREDFEKWLKFIGEDALAAEVATLRKKALSGERCREQMCAKVEAHLKRKI